MDKFRFGVACASYTCLAIGLFATLISLLWIALGGTDDAIFQNAVLMMFLSVIGAGTCLVINVGANAVSPVLHRVSALFNRRTSSASR